MAMTLLTTNTSTNATASSFTSSIDGTYPIYVFKWYDVNPVTDSAVFQFNASTDGGSNYNMTKTTSAFRADHKEDDSATSLTYDAGDDLAQSTSAQHLHEGGGNGADESAAGELFLFNPSNTTYVKHFYSTCSCYVAGDAIEVYYVAGYINSTNDVDAIQFSMSTGNMDAVIKMYGIGN